MSTVKKTGSNTGQFRKGKDSRRGGGKKGRSGRKPLEFKAECSRLADEQVLAKVGGYLEDSPMGPADPTWRWCAEYVTNYSKTKPVQPVQVTGKDGAPIAVQVIQFGDRKIAF